MKSPKPVSIVWFRRDLRLEDNAALFHALKGNHPVLCLFIFDTGILSKLKPDDARVSFIHDTLHQLKLRIESHGSSLITRIGSARSVWKNLGSELKQDGLQIDSVYFNDDYEPAARQRDAEIISLLMEQSIRIECFKDQCIFEKNEIVKSDGTPYTVFTPYFRKWAASLNSFYLKSYPSERLLKNLVQQRISGIFPTLAALGFTASSVKPLRMDLSGNLIANYDKTRNLPAIAGTSRVGLYLRFGTVSIRKLATEAKNLNQVYLSELAWRDFFMMILFFFPQSVDSAFKPAYDRIEWRPDADGFGAWSEGRTGYPLVDAGMRELNWTGFMHNRVRMVCASFLTKHLLIDWRKGERYFAEKLMDFDLSANVGNWQWAAGCGCDAAPYFRIFNPSAQQKKFDPENEYVNKWIPELHSEKYPGPIVDHARARARCLTAFAKALKK